MSALNVCHVHRPHADLTWVRYLSVLHFFHTCVSACPVRLSPFCPGSRLQVVDFRSAELQDLVLALANGDRQV